MMSVSNKSTSLYIDDVGYHLQPFSKAQ